MEYPFRFDWKKGLEAIVYIANRSPNKTFHHISKIMYFADRLHLEKYGRFICGDKYCAMKHGPVPSGIYDILKLVRGNEPCSYFITPMTIDTFKDAFTVIDNYNVQAARESNIKLFSESDLECIDEAISQYGSLEFTKLADVSHDQAWENTDANDIMEIEGIINTLSNPKEIFEHINNPHP